MKYQTIILYKDERISTLTLNRPDKLNALNPQMMTELVHAFHTIDDDKDTRVLIITGAGRGFCSGADLSAQRLPNNKQSEDEDTLKREHDDATLKGFPVEAPLLLSKMKKPVISAINGVAVGGGCTFTLLSDIRIASEAARFSIPLAHRGFTLELGSSYFLSRIVGIGKACEMVFTGKMIDAREAREIGLVNHVVPPDELMSVTTELARNIARAAPLATQVSKEGLYLGMNNDLPGQLRWETLALRYLAETDDQKEAIRAFMEKIEPEFKGY